VFSSSPFAMASSFWTYRTAKSVFSAKETQKSKSSIVAMNVAVLSSDLISVVTSLPFLLVVTVKPGGVL